MTETYGLGYQLGKARMKLFLFSNVLFCDDVKEVVTII